MANATGIVESPTVDYNDTDIRRDIDAAETEIHIGAMVSIDATGMAVKAQNTVGHQFDGIAAEHVIVDAGGSDGDFKIRVKRPFRFGMKIAAAVVTDIGRAVYVLFDNEVTYSGSILVGWVDEILDATHVLIRPIQNLKFKQSTAVAITGATTILLADSGGIFTVDQDAAFDIDLPSPTTGAGSDFTIVLTDAGTNNVTVTVLGDAATFVGTITIDGATIPATGSTLTFANGAAAVGDSIVVKSLATNLYHIQAIASAAGGITIA